MEMSSLETLTETRKLKNTLYNLLQITLVQHWNGGEITNLMKKIAIPNFLSLNKGL